jgi:hypothetical protein
VRGSNGALRSQLLVTPKRAKADQQSTKQLCKSPLARAAKNRKRGFSS